MKRREIDPDLYGCWLTNKSTYSKNHEFPIVYAKIDNKIEFLCLPGEKYELENLGNTCLCFYVDDHRFDTLNGLYNAIIYKDQKLLDHYYNKYKNLKYVITPDYSTYYGLSKAWIINQINKARTVTLWFQKIAKCICIPNITFSIEEYDNICLEGIQKESAVAISLKGLMQNDILRKRTIDVIKKVVDQIVPSRIIVYTDAINKNTIKFFEYAEKHNIPIDIPNNTLKERNENRWRIRHGQRI